jgi:hypothetical protein
MDDETFRRVKELVPELPSEVADIWLTPFIKRFGWPPHSSNDWKYVLKGTKDLAFLQSLRGWELKQVEIIPEKLNAKDKDIIGSLFQANLLGLENSFSVMMSDSKSRFDSIAKYLSKTGKIPRPLILAEKNESFDILDGYHRVTAFLAYSGYFNTKIKMAPNPKITAQQSAWVANPTKPWW